MTDPRSPSCGVSLGPLHGLPVMENTFETAGLRTIVDGYEPPPGV